MVTCEHVYKPHVYRPLAYKAHKAYGASADKQFEKKRALERDMTRNKAVALILIGYLKYVLSLGVVLSPVSSSCMFMCDPEVT